MNFLSTALKHAVSQNRCRFVDTEYDLDLTYITNRIIAMGLPSDGVRALYRNNATHIASFLKQYHNNHFMVFNLSQLHYDAAKFDHNVMLMGWPDHHNPTLDLLFSIVKTMHAWLSSDEKNVVAVHCLAGKGRTGTVIVCYLLYIGMCRTVRDALEYFAMKRTSIHNVDRGSFACVDSPSQVTYIEYFYRMICPEDTVNHDAVIEAPPVYLDVIYLYNVPFFMLNAMDNGRFRLGIYRMETFGPNDTRLVQLAMFSRPTSYWKQSNVSSSTSSIVAFRCNGVELDKDIVIACKIVNTLTVEEVFRFAFHTAFVQIDDDNLTNGEQQREIRLKKNKFMMDGALKNDLISDNFMVDVVLNRQQQIHQHQQSIASSSSSSPPPSSDIVQSVIVSGIDQDTAISCIESDGGTQYVVSTSDVNSSSPSSSLLESVIDESSYINVELRHRDQLLSSASVVKQGRQRRQQQQQQQQLQQQIPEEETLQNRHEPVEDTEDPQQIVIQRTLYAPLVQSKHSNVTYLQNHQTITISGDGGEGDGGGDGGSLREQEESTSSSSEAVESVEPVEQTADVAPPLHTLSDELSNEDGSSERMVQGVTNWDEIQYDTIQ